MEKQKVVVSAGNSTYEFEGELLEITDEYLVLKAKHGDIYIERRYLVFIQYMNDIALETEAQIDVPTKSLKNDAAAKFLNKRLRHDPLNQVLHEKFTPMSQLSDDEDNDEVMKNIYSSVNREPFVPNNLKDAINVAMKSTDDELSFNGDGISYQNPAQTILGKHNANIKKIRGR